MRGKKDLLARERRTDFRVFSRKLCFFIIRWRVVVGARHPPFTFYGSVKTTVFPPPRLTPSRSREKESFCEIYPRRYEPAPPLDQVTRPSDGHALSSLKRISVISSSTNFFGFRKILERYTADNNRYAVQLRHLLFKWSFAYWTLPVF